MNLQFERMIKPMMQNGIQLRYCPKVQRYYTADPKSRDWTQPAYGLSKSEVANLEKKRVLTLVGHNIYKLENKDTLND